MSTTALLQSAFAAHHALYPSRSPVLPLPPRVHVSKPQQRNYALEERAAEIKAEIVADLPYLWNKSDRHHHEDIIEHISYEKAFTDRTAKLIRDACRSEVSAAEIGIEFWALIGDAIGHQAALDLESAELAEEEAGEWDEQP